MTFRKFAFNNVLRNKRLYAAYFISSLFTVMVFFTFLNFAFHPTLMEADFSDSVLKGMLVAGGIIYVFSFFFILYSMSSFLQSRKREFGVLMIQGMSSGQIRKMVFLENMLIGFFATIFAIGLGIVFSKAILLLAENVIVLEIDLPFYLPITPILITFISFMLLFFFISIFVTSVLRTNKVVTLIKGSQIGKQEPKASLFWTFVAVLLLAVGYFFAIWTKGMQVMVAFIPVTILVIIGSYLLFTQLNVYLVRLLKSRKSLFWKKTNMLLFADLSYRMKDNARAFFMVAIISTVAFTAIGSLVGFNSFLTGGMKEANPYTFDYTQYKQEDEEIVFIEKTLAEHGINYDKAEHELEHFTINDNEVLVITPDVYNDYARLQGNPEVSVGANEIIIVESGISDLIPKDQEMLLDRFILNDGTEMKVNKNDQQETKPFVVPEPGPYYIVGEEVYEQLGKPDDSRYSYVWEARSGTKDDWIAAGHDITSSLITFMAIDQIVYDIQSIYSPIMFIGLFIGIVFFVASGSFLYFRLYTDLNEDKEKFAAISKIGLTTKEANRVISKQIALLFFAPIIVAIIHGAVALTALSHMFQHSLLFESTLVLGAFFLIQICYYLFVRYFYVKQIHQMM